MPPHVRRGGARGRSNTPRHAAQARADLSAGRSAPRTQGKFAAFDEFCKRLNLDEFQKAGYLSERQRTALDTIFEAGHAAIHRGWEPTEDDIRTLMDITESVIESVYLHGVRAERLEKVVPKRLP